MFAPYSELLPEIVDWATVVVPKLSIAPPPFVPAVFPVNVLSLTLTWCRCRSRRRRARCYR